MSITRTFQPTSCDSYVDQTYPDTNHDATATNMDVDGESGDACRSYVKTDVSSMPDGSAIISATLSAYEYTAPVGIRDLSVHRVTGADWDEATITWNNQPAYVATPTAEVASGTTNGVWIEWTVTTDVDLWVNQAATNSNYGWCVKDSLEDLAPSRLIQFYTKEYTTDPTLQPKLSITFIAPWDSYRTSAREVQWGDTDTPYDSNYYITYMKGTGFASGYYNVGYYDGAGDWIATDENIEVLTDGILNSQYDLTTDKSAVGDNWWHALVQPASGYTAFPSTPNGNPNAYDRAINNPDTYGLLANDSFYVGQSAIPEFPTIIAGIVVLGLCFVIYYWMRKRKLAHVKA